MIDCRFSISRMYRYQILPLKRWRHDQCTRLERNRQMHITWSNQLEDLTLAYLKWKYGGESSAGGNSPGSHIFQVDKVGLRGAHIIQPFQVYLFNYVQNTV